MAESALGRMKDEVAGSPATERLKTELRNYLEARAQHAVTTLGGKLGESVSKLGDPSRGGGDIAGTLKDTVKDQVVGTVKDKAKHSVTDAVKGLFGKGRKGGGGKSKSVTIVEDIDVGVPVREAYDQWTAFQEFSSFAKGVVSVEKADDTTSNWKVKVAKSTRSWKANVTEQVPDERISWTTEGAKGTVKGVVTFHAVTDDLTRVLLVLEYFPKGLFEKTGNIWRAQGRRARLDLKLYRKFIMMRGEATDGWRGEIRDGEVVVGHEDAVAEESQDEHGPEDGAEDREAPRDDEDGPYDEDDRYEDEDEADRYEDDEPERYDAEDDERYDAADEEPADEELNDDEADAEEAADEEPDDEPAPRRTRRRTPAAARG
ncbi:SRPBCC family protein [Streptomyces sp. NRRL F-5135]|uniref:SRPBCC family protein n=1 Tax=Streptomyces sp. NRRL F-5135 TaxID=1463858 RepID=UPI0004C54FEF|nr:SRPBCC family protein [Streptomyces sp. NRRL F-5135]